MSSKIKKILSITLTVLFSVISYTNSVAQEQSKNQIKEESQLNEQNQIALLINSKKFVFKAKTVIPQGARTVILTDVYTMKFNPDTIKSHLPFFGRGYSGVGYDGDNGMNFEGKPEKFDIEKTKKAYIIKTEVKTEQDFYSIELTVYFDGSAYLFINSNKRSYISYNGNVKAIENK